MARLAVAAAATRGLLCRGPLVVAARSRTRFLVTSSNQGPKFASQFRTPQHLLSGGALVFGLTAGFAVASAASADTDFAAVRKDIAAIIEREETGPIFVRLAWHTSGTYDKKTGTGGSYYGTMRFKPESMDGANNGLVKARDLLEPLKKKYPGISYGDLWTLAGVVAVEEMGGPAVAWRSGRTDSEDPARVPANGRLPDADKGEKSATIQHIRDIFYRMGFSDKEIVALLGAHAVGRCHPENSGYWGPWTRAETTFSNEFFRELLENKWTPKKTHEGKPWAGPAQFEDPSGDLMMLPTDMALTWDDSFRKYVEMYAKDEELWHKDFAAAFSKLLELGCPFAAKPWYKFW